MGRVSEYQREQLGLDMEDEYDFSDATFEGNRERKSRNVDPSRVEEAKQLLSDMRDLYEEMPEEAEEFATNVLSKAESICSSVESYGNATDNQLRALENMKYGMKKWINNRRY